MTAPTPQPITNPTYTGISTPNNPITNPPFIPLQNNLGVIIGAACGGVVLLILIVVLVYCFVRKQRNKTPKSKLNFYCSENGGNNLHGREEVDNPLYATSGLNNAQGSGHDNPSFINGAEKSGKEEKVNPLYVPSDQPDQIEGAYAEVDKKKKSGKETTIKEEKVNPLYAP
uniref:Uncharacterized protein n=1 Tax=Ciona savignyi TaxID=51511 RepID=H2Y3Z3_CIOSA